MLKKTLFFIISVLVNTFLYAQQDESAKVTVTNGLLTRCVADSLVKIKIVPRASKTWTSIKLDWGDNTGIVTLNQGDSLELKHTYKTAEFLDKCAYNCRNRNGFCFTIDLIEVKYTDNTEDNNALTVTFKLPPKPAFTVNPQPACEEQKISFTNQTCPNNDEDMKYSWKFHEGTSATSKDTSFLYLTAGSYQVMLTAMNTCSTVSTTQNVEIIKPAVAKIVADSGFVEPLIAPYKVCLGGGGVVKLNGNTSENATSYTWSSSSSNIRWLTSKNIPNPRLAFTEKGTYTITLTADNSCAQKDTQTITVNVFDANVLTLTPQPDACTALSYTPNPLVAGASYTVNGNPVSTFPLLLPEGQYIIEATLSNECSNQIKEIDTFLITSPITPTILQPTKDTVVCAGSNSIPLRTSQSQGRWIQGTVVNGNFNPEREGVYLLIYAIDNEDCERRDSITITVQGASPSTRDIQVCEKGAPVALLGTPTSGTWSSSDCPTCVANNSFIPSNVPAGQSMVQIIYTLTNSIGCSAQANATVKVLRPTAKFILQPPFCTNFPLNVDTTISTADLLWRVDGRTTTLPFTNLQEGSHTIELVVNVEGCKDSSTQVITVAAPPANAHFSLNNTAGCPPLAVTFAANDSIKNNFTYNWIFEGGSLPDFNGYRPLNSILFDNKTSETQRYKTTFQVKNTCGLVSQDTFLQVFPKPIAEIGIDSTKMGCSPFQVILTNRSKGNPDSCIWTISDGSRISSCINSFQRIFYAKDSTVTYSLQLTAINECGISTYLDTIKVVPSGMQAYYNLPDYTVCPFDTIQFTDASTPIPAFIRWDFGDGTFSNERKPKHVFANSNQRYKVVLTASTGCGFDTIQHIVSTLQAPPLDFQLPAYACEGQVFDVMNLSPDNYFAYYWNFGDGSSDSTHYDTKHIFSTGGKMETVQLTVVDFDNFCFNRKTKSILVRNKPVAAFKIDSTTIFSCAPRTIQIKNTSQFFNQGKWYINQEQKSQEQDLSIDLNAGTYDVALIASYDGICVDTLTREDALFVDSCKIYIPNAFTPNEDGVNDYFTIYPSVQMDSVNLMIFNGWGGLLYEESYTKTINPICCPKWDGTWKGKPLNPDVFVYQIRAYFLDGTSRYFKGDVTLIK